MKRILVISVLAALLVPAPAQAGWRTECQFIMDYPLCLIFEPFNGKSKKTYKNKLQNVSPYYAAAASKEYRKTALRKPPRTLQDPRVK